MIHLADSTVPKRLNLHVLAGVVELKVLRVPRVDDHVVVELDHDKVLQFGEVLGEGGVKVVAVLVVDGGDELGLVRVEVVVQGVVPVLK